MRSLLPWDLNVSLCQGKTYHHQTSEQARPGFLRGLSALNKMRGADGTQLASGGSGEDHPLCRQPTDHRRQRVSSLAGRGAKRRQSQAGPRLGGYQQEVCILFLGQWKPGL